MNDIEIIEATIEWNDTHDIENVLFATTDTENTPLDEQIFYTGVTRRQLEDDRDGLAPISDEWHVIAVNEQ